MDDCEEILAMLAQHELLLHAEEALRTDGEIGDAERDEMILHCRKEQLRLLTSMEKHKKSCIIYNPNVFREP